MPDWKRLTIDAIHDSGCVKLREYWRNAWMPPIVIAPAATWTPPSTAMATKFRLPTSIVAGWITPEMNCAPKLASYSSSFVVAEDLFDFALAAERLHDRVTGERLLDLGVQLAGVPPLRDEARPRALARWRASATSTSGCVTSATSASSHEIQIIMATVPTSISDLREHLRQRLLEALGDVVDVVRDAAQQVAALRAVDVARAAGG